ncbi:MAG TPA: alcohol dehydrogenase, partial [Beijerinckiaceae bacterium]|nr:alcohol dehydrogenase [Beijerinckiaceae bacterium]
GYPLVDVVEPAEHRRRFAEEVGARPVAPDALPRRYPLIVEASGKAAARQLALESVAPLGAVVQIGEAERWDVEETRTIRRKDFFYIRSFYFPKSEYEENLALFRADRAIYARFVDASAGLQGLPELFNDFSSGRRIKPAVILPH